MFKDISALNIVFFICLVLIMVYICYNVRSMFAFIPCLIVIIFLFYILVLDKGAIMNTNINSVISPSNGILDTLRAKSSIINDICGVIIGN